MAPVVIPLLVALAVFVALWAGFARLRHGRVAVAELRRRLDAPADADERDLLRGESAGGARVARWLADSGMPLSVERLYRWVLLGAAAGVLVGLGLGGAGLALVGGLAGALVLPARVALARGRRRAQLDRQFPQALTLMVLALRAGHALPGALALAAREAPQPVRDELAVAVDQHTMGRHLGEVIGQLAERLNGSETARTFAVAVLVLEQTGGNLIEVIDRIVETARARAQYKSKLRALTAQGRTSAWILGSIPPLFMGIAATVDPNYGRTIVNSGAAGYVVLALATAMWASGAMWTWRMVAKAD